MLQTELVLDRLEPLKLALPIFLSPTRTHVLAALDHLGTQPKEYPKLYADSFAASLRAAINDDPIEGWEIQGPSNCLHMRDKETHLKLRFLKEFAYEGDVPPAGNNQTRITAWVQEPLMDVEATGKRPLKDVRLVLVWKERNGLFDCTVYQTETAGDFPKGAKARTVMQIPITPNLNNTSFNPDTSDEEHIVPKKNIVIREASKETVTS